MNEFIIPNGPAFPVHIDRNPDSYGAGLTIRTELAARFMQGLLCSWGQHDVHDYNEMALDAISAADSLINALNAPER